MINIDICDAKKRLSALLSSCIKNDDVITMRSKKGNVVLLSEKCYNNMIESIYLAGINGVHEDVDKVTKTPSCNFSKTAPWD